MVKKRHIDCELRGIRRERYADEGGETYANDIRTSYIGTNNAAVPHHVSRLWFDGIDLQLEEDFHPALFV